MIITKRKQWFKTKSLQSDLVSMKSVTWWSDVIVIKLLCHDNNQKRKKQHKHTQSLTLNNTHIFSNIHSYVSISLNDVTKIIYFVNFSLMMFNIVIKVKGKPTSR